MDAGPLIHRQACTQVGALVDQIGSSVTIPVEASVVAETQPGALHGVEAADVTVAAGLSVAEVTPA